MEVKQLAKEVLEFLDSQYDRNTFKFRFEVSYSFDGEEEIWLNVCDKDGKGIKVITSNFLKYIFNITPMEYIEERKMWLWQKELIDEIEGS
jgi:hypothetical protein